MTDQLYRESFGPGTVIFREGEPGDHAYVIESGQVQISALREGREVPLAHLGAGELFGEMALIDQQVRSATARSLDQTTLVVISRDHVETKIDNADPLLNLFLKVILQRLRTTNSLVRQQLRAREADVSLPQPSDPTLHQLRERAMSSLKLEQDVEIAIEQQQFELFYQPIVSVQRHGSVEGLEALIRWRHPERGLVPPLQFIGLAESTGLIVPIGLWVLEEACAALERMQRQSSHPASLFMSINLSVRQIAEPDLVESIRRVLQRTAIEPAALKLEVTESALMCDPDTAAQTLGRLKQLGVRLAVDDFGTGYSSLSYLHRFPIDVLKVDRSFVSRMLSDSVSLKIVRSIARLAQELSLQVVAEGVERQEELVVLQDLGCEYAQGYYFSKPRPFNEIVRFLRI